VTHLKDCVIVRIWLRRFFVGLCHGDDSFRPTPQKKAREAEPHGFPQLFPDEGALGR
jgi:hypothetical protein